MARLALKGGVPVRKKRTIRWPVYDHRERKALNRVLKSKSWGGFPAPNTEARAFAERFALHHDARYGICAANGTVTLEVALRAGGIVAGDEVLVPALTWIATAAAAVYINAVPVFVDIDPDTYCMDPRKLEEAITPKTRAVIPVHLGCSIADMDRIMSIAGRHNLLVVEDCAHMHGGKWNGKGVGSIGHLGSFSFQSSKLMTAGEGGIILTSDKELEEKCQSLVNCGRKEKGYDSFEGHVFGWNYRISEFQAAVLSVQLERLAEQAAHREANVNRFADYLKSIRGLTPLYRDPRITTFACYEYILRYDSDAFDGIHRDRFAEALNAEGIPCDPYFYTPIYHRDLFPLRSAEYPLCSDRYGSDLDPHSVSCPVAEKAAYSEALWFHHSLFIGDQKDVDDMIEAIQKIRENLDELRP